MKQQVRVAAKAIIIRDGLVLAIRKQQDETTFYALPGGKQSVGSSLAETLERECFEELGIAIMVGPLRFVRDYRADRHEFAGLQRLNHRVELFFECSIAEDAEPTEPPKPDKRQVGVEWLPLATLCELPLYPHAVRDRLPTLTEQQEPVYLGDVN
jgi:8-oxo-dGTP diphosphatase